MWAAPGVSSTVLVAHDYGASVGQEVLARRAEGALSVAIDARGLDERRDLPGPPPPTVGQQILLDPDDGAEIGRAVTEESFVSGLRVTWGTVAFDEDEIGRSGVDGRRDGVALMHDLCTTSRIDASTRPGGRRARGSRRAHDVRLGDLDPVSGAHMIERVEERIPRRP